MLITYLNSSSQVLKETWTAINSYHIELLKPLPDSAVLQNLIGDIDTVYSRKILFFKAPPEKKINVINDYLQSSFKYRSLECKCNISDTLNTKIFDDPINTKDLFNKIEHLIGILNSNLDSLDNSSLDGKGLSTIMRVISHNIKIDNNPERLAKYQLYALKMIMEELENMNDRNYEFIENLNQNDDSRVNKLILTSLKINRETCQQAKMNAKLEMERNYQILKRRFSKYLNK